MGTDWLFPIPPGENLGEQLEQVAEWLSQDAAAAAIPDEEAEAFMSAGYLVRSLEPRYFALQKRFFGLPSSDNSPKVRRTSTLRMLRKWKIPKFQKALRYTIISTLLNEYLDAETNPQFWTDERFAEALCDTRILMLWVVQVYRYLRPGADVREWIRSVEPVLEERYQLSLDVARLAMRRIVYPEAAAGAATAQVASAALVEELKGKNQKSGLLRQGVRRLQQERKQLKEDARRREQEKRAALTQARGEVAGARRAFADQKAVWQRQLADHARQMEAELSRLRKRIEQARSGFHRDLAALRGPFLRGRRIWVCGGDAETARVMVETLGGRWAASEPEFTLPAEQRVVDLEQQLQRLLLHKGEIHCDGSRRRSGRRPPIATSAFQFYADRIPVHHERRVVCCGPVATSLMAEYGALVMALNWLAARAPLPGTAVEVWSDCKFLVQHVTGKRPLAQMRGCVTLDRKLRALLRRLERSGCQVTLRWVRRDYVEPEDRLCELTYREAAWYRRAPEEVSRVPLKRFLQSL